MRASGHSGTGTQAEGRRGKGRNAREDAIVHGQLRVSFGLKTKRMGRGTWSSDATAAGTRNAHCERSKKKPLDPMPDLFPANYPLLSPLLRSLRSPYARSFSFLEKPSSKYSLASVLSLCSWHRSHSRTRNSLPAPPVPVCVSARVAHPGKRHKSSRRWAQAQRRGSRRQ